MTNELTLQWRGLRDKLMRGDEEEETVPVMIETGDMLVREIERLTRERDVSRAAIDQLHAAVKTAQELAARRLMEIDRLKKREKDLMDVIDSRDRALGFVPLDEVHASRTGEAIVTNEQLIAIEMKPLEGCAAVLVSFNRPFTHVEMNAMHRALNEHLIPHDNEPSESPQAPIAKIIVRESGAGHYAPDDVYVKLYAPGLPPGEHDVYCEPMSVAPALGASRDASSTGSSLPPTQHVAGGWGYSCTEAVRCSHGKVDGECLVIPCAHYGQKT